MTRKQRRVRNLLIGGILVGGATIWLGISLSPNLVFFHSPSELARLKLAPEEVIRIGGLVVEGSLQSHASPPGARFAVTDFEQAIDVIYLYGDPLPDLFREGQGVIAEGKLGQEGVFWANRILAKHDENYMPPEVAEILPPPPEARLLPKGNLSEGDSGSSAPLSPLSPPIYGKGSPLSGAELSAP